MDSPIDYINCNEISEGLNDDVIRKKIDNVSLAVMAIIGLNNQDLNDF